MSAIARYYNFKGLEVSGYDRTPSPLTAELEKEGIAIHYEDRPDLVPDEVENCLVIYTPAIPEDLKEMQFVKAKGYKLVKRAAMLGELSRGKECLAVAGTHGKTSTSTLCAHILEQSGEGCTAFLGGISLNYGSNLLLSHNNVIVAEADEFDRSFLQLHPDYAAITAMDADHLDIYGKLECMQQAYREFAAQVKKGIVAKYGLPLDPKNFGARIWTYSADDSRADFHASGIRLQADGHYLYDLHWPGGTIKDILVGTLGRLNVENSIAAAALCLLHGTPPEQVKAGIGSFKGVKRRMEEYINRPGLTFIDDYAHHPAEIEATLSSIKEMFPGRKVCAIFQPHLYTRTRDFAPEFAKALSLAHEVLLLDIYPARELPIEGVDSRLIFKDIQAPKKELLQYGELLGFLKGKDDLDVLVSFGAGNIDRLVPQIAQLLEK